MPASFNTRPTRSRGRYRPLAEINVTPLVDVMLVLLIIFMVTAPLMTSGVTVNLPKANATPISQDATPITISIDASGEIFLGDTKVPLNALVGKLRAIANNDPARRIFVRGDRSIAYGRIMQVMATITQGGFTKVALLAEEVPPTSAATRSPESGSAGSVHPGSHRTDSMGPGGAAKAKNGG